MLTCFSDTFAGNLGTWNERMYVFLGGGRKYSCLEGVEEAPSLFLNGFADTYQRLAGGILS